MGNSSLHNAFNAAIPFQIPPLPTKKNPAGYNRPGIKDTHDFSMLACTK
jgi:hypothetical protein